jgi:hypothetical protein
LFSASGFAQPVVVVLDYGAEPRQELRYRYAVGEAQKATMSMDIQMTLSMGGGVQMPGISMPTIRMPVSMRTTEVLPDGSARYEIEMSAAEIDESASGNPLFGGALAAGLGQYDGATGWMWVDTRGQHLDGGFGLPVDLNPQAAQMMGNVQGQMQQMSAPFPAEAVGFGARWQLTTTSEMMGMAVAQTAEYTLLSRDGDNVELGVTIGQTIDMQTAALPAGIPPEALAALGTMTSEGSGTMTIDLDYTVPYTEMNMTSAMSMGAELAGQAQNMSMNLQMRMAITPE